jgi:hypothetical protein
MLNPATHAGSAFRTLRSGKRSSFLHERACTPHTGSVGLPTQLTSRQLSIRAFDREAMMLDAAIIDGIHLEEQLRRFFENDAVSEIHVHNATRGCWATSVIRSP